MRAAELALAWLGTPYRHQAALKGIGCDCLGLVRGVYAELTGLTPAIPPYTPDWAEAGGDEMLIDGLSRLLEPVALATAKPGDVLVFRLRAGVPAKHAAILVSPDEMVHAHQGAAVSRVALSLWWRRHLAAAFRFTSSD